MTATVNTAREPAWSWIIGGGLVSILIGGAMLQMQFGGVGPSTEFQTISGYEKIPSQAAPSLSTPAPEVAVQPAAAAPPSGATRLRPFSPPAHQPDWLVSPCSTIRANEIQRAWAKHLGLPVEVQNRLGQSFRLIPPGIYDRGSQTEQMQSLMGSMPKEDTHWRDCLLSSTPAHRVVVSKPFYLAVNETTQAEFKAILGRNPAWYSASGPEPYYVDRVKGEDTSRHPVEGVTWKDAQEFAQKLASSELGQIVGLAAFRSSRLSEQACSSEFSEVDCGLAGEVASRSLSSIHYRLPTDAEWEHACRGGTASPFSFGETEPVAMGWFGEANGGRTWEVGRGEVNPLGLYGVHTGVWEWVEDHWSVPEYGQYRDWPVLDPLHSAGTPLPHVVRGGMWPDRRSRSFDRYAYDADFQTFFVGFRLVLDLPAMPD